MYTSGRAHCSLLHNSVPMAAPFRRFFLLLATLLRRREELLAATGPQVRTILSDTLSPANMAKRLDGEDNIVGENGSKTSALVLWCKEAESLDLTTPESFRHHLALIGEIAEAEHEV